MRIDIVQLGIGDGLISATGRRRSVEFRVPDGVQTPQRGVVRAVRGGWLATAFADRPGTTQLIVVLGRGGSVRPLQLGGKPLTARTLGAAISLPIAAGEKPKIGEQAFALRPVGYEAATNSDVVAYDEPAANREVVARVPRDGSAPTLVQRGERGVQYAAISW